MSEPVRACGPDPIDLDHWTRVLLDQQLPSAALGLRSTADAVDIALLPLVGEDDVGRHPADALVGFTAPEPWEAFGVACDGAGHALDLTGSGAPWHLSMVHLVGRDGRSCTAILPEGAPEPLQVASCEPAVGLVADACRRALGLPTAPEPEPPATWLSAVWADRVLARAMAAPSVAQTWDDLCLLHPCVGSGLAAGLDSITWDDLRASVILELPAFVPGGPEARAACSPERAAWLDAPSFGRHLLASLPPLDALLATLDEATGGPAAQLVRRVSGRGCRR